MVEDEKKVSLRELEVLASLINEGKTTAAAYVLGISQPAISRTLANLEVKMGRILFKRSNGRLSPTPEALMLNQKLQPVFDTLASIHDISWDRRPTTLLQIATSPTLAHRFIHQVMAGFLRENPDVEVLLDIGTTPEIVSAVAQGVALGISDSLATHPGVRSLPFRSTRAVCLLPEGSPLAEKAVITPQDLQDHDFIALTNSHSLGATIDAVFRQARVPLKTVVRTVTTVSAVECVKLGLGATIISPFPVCLSPDFARLTVRPFEPVLPQQTAFIISAGTPLSPVASAFMDYLREHQPDCHYSQALK